ncbi:MAG TPA: hypothetical protein PLF88_13200, partial [Opitutaceae bacterium]|nr:hypothetical protein [Opitutaceae bacterium]
MPARSTAASSEPAVCHRLTGRTFGSGLFCVSAGLALDTPRISPSIAVMKPVARLLLPVVISCAILPAGLNAEP